MSETSGNERLLTTGEVAALFRVDPKTVSRWVEAGKLSRIRTPGGKKTRGHSRYRESEVRALLRNHEEAAASEGGVVVVELP